MLFADVDENVASMLLHSIVNLWVLMRGLVLGLNYTNRPAKKCTIFQRAAQDTFHRLMSCMHMVMWGKCALHIK